MAIFQNSLTPICSVEVKLQSAKLGRKNKRSVQLRDVLFALGTVLPLIRDSLADFILGTMRLNGLANGTSVIFLLENSASKL